MLVKDRGQQAWQGLSSVAPLRFRRYESSSHRDPLDHYAMYLWNLALSRDIYASIQALEVVLRSRIHQEMSRRYSNDFWFEDQSLMGRHELRAISDLRSSRRNITLSSSADQIVASLPFNYWVAIYGSNYTSDVHNQISASVFPHRKARLRRGDIAHKLGRIRKLRNRVAHHECICDIPTLQETYGFITDLLGDISPDYAALEARTSRFMRTFRRGSAPYRLYAALRIRFDSY
ncbi:MAG: Abi family protein [Armatimonadetes bacterium]|nr:Abi family protein [Armatimonadota bacterium]